MNGWTQIELPRAPGKTAAEMKVRKIDIGVVEVRSQFPGSCEICFGRIPTKMLFDFSAQ
jgi:hypothetical protein